MPVNPIAFEMEIHLQKSISDTMKNSFLLITTVLFVMLSQNALAQNKTAIKFIADPNPWGNMDLGRLANWEGVHYYKAKFAGKQLKGKNYSVVTKEIWYGAVKKVDTLFNSASSEFFEPIKGDTLALTIMAGKSSEKSLKTEFYFDRFSVAHEYLTTNSEDYSMRILDRQKTDIEVGKPFYAFAYILPYEKDGAKYYCAVEGSGKDIEKWGTEFGLEHYILYEMRFF